MEVSGVKQEMAIVGLKAAQASQSANASAAVAMLQQTEDAVKASAPTAPGVGGKVDIKA